MPLCRSLPRPTLVLGLAAALCVSSAADAQTRAKRTKPVPKATTIRVDRFVPPAGSVPVRATIRGTDIVHAARRYIGVRYLWGGNTPRAFDCSGYIRWVYAEYGIELPRTAREQAGVGIAPYPGDLRTGDLLFFYGGQGAQHIAIYVGGDTIIHASSAAKRVRLDVMRRPGSQRGWFSKRLIAVRRILPAEGVFYIPGAAPTPPAVVASRDPDEIPRPQFRLAPTVF
jgi:cell wall-associated NlpC family hydrolase